MVGLVLAGLPITSPGTPWTRTPSAWTWAWLEALCAELASDARAIGRLQRPMERKLRAANPEHYDYQKTLTNYSNVSILET